MKFIKSFQLFESASYNLPGEISIEDFLKKINFTNPYTEAYLKEKGMPSESQTVVDWWHKNRSNIKIHLFPFNCPQPIMGSFMDENSIVVNSKSIQMMPKAEMRLFLALHESRHADQHAEGKFMDGYFQSVVDDDYEKFSEFYSELEKDANDFAENALREMGFDHFCDGHMIHLRGNERQGSNVFSMMKQDIRKFGPVEDFFELLAKQIL